MGGTGVPGTRLSGWRQSIMLYGIGEIYR